MPPNDEPLLTSRRATSAGVDSPTPIRAVLVGLCIGLLSAAVGIAVGAATLPTSDDLQRASLEEIGLDPRLLDNPLIGPIIDELSQRVQDRVVDEARHSVVLAVGSSAGVAVGGVLIVMLAAQRRRRVLTHDDARRMS